MLAQVGRIAVIEALVLGAKAGLDPQTMVDVIGHATGNSVAFQYTAPRVVSRDFDGIRMDITYKDLELQTTLAKSLNVPLILATICQQIYQMGRATGMGSEDGAAIVKIYEQMTGRGGGFYLIAARTGMVRAFADLGGISNSGETVDFISRQCSAHGLRLGATPTVLSGCLVPANTRSS